MHTIVINWPSHSELASWGVRFWWVYLLLNSWAQSSKVPAAELRIHLGVLQSLRLDQFSSVQSLSCTDSLRFRGLQHTRPPCPSPTPGVHSNSRLLSQWCHSSISSSVVTFSSDLQFFPASGVFSNESVLCIRWPKYWSFSFGISPSNEHPVFLSFRMDWLDLLAVQGTLKSLLQHHSWITRQ